MITVKEPILKTSQKLDILRHLFSDQPIASLLQGLEQIEIAAFQNFIWDKTIEFGIRAQGKNFSQENILTKIRRSLNINTVPEQQVAQQIEIIFEIAKEYVHHATHPEMTNSTTSKVNSI